MRSAAELIGCAESHLSDQESKAHDLVIVAAGQQSRDSSDETSILAKILHSNIQKLQPDQLFELLVADDPEPDPINVVYKFFAQTLERLKKRTSLSIDKLITELQNNDIIAAFGDDIVRQNKARKALFTIIGWLTLLYVPVFADSDTINISSEDTASRCVHSQPLDICRRPFPELLRGFGGILPDRTDPSWASLTGEEGKQEATEDKLHVSLLNVSTLKRIGKIEIIWIKCPGAHLEFDPKERRLKMFAFPSYCKINDHDQSFYSRLVKFIGILLLSDHACSIIKGLGAGMDFSSGPAKSYNLLKEIVHSFGLLFRDDSKARGEYKNSERVRSRLSGQQDNYLDELCGYHIRGRFSLSSKAPKRESYSVQDEFPILAERLLRIQRYAQSIQANRVSSLWYDRRNLLQWYTFWAVFWIGGISIILSIIQVGLGAAQVAVAFQALDMQKSEG